jgi:dTMP kinase
MGLFITFEGTEGVGKTTIIEKLFTNLENLGYKVYVSREPGGDLLGEKIRSLLLETDNVKISPASEALLFAASRASHIDNVLLSKLEKFDIVICDRYLDSSIAYQGYGRQLGEEFVRTINVYADKLVPKLTFFLDLDIDVGLSRTDSRNKKDRLDKESIDFFKRVKAGYLQIITNEPRFVRIDMKKKDPEVVEFITERIIEQIGK